MPEKMVSITCGQLRSQYLKAKRFVSVSTSLDEIQGQAAYIQLFQEHLAHCAECAARKEELDRTVSRSVFPKW